MDPSTTSTQSPARLKVSDLIAAYGAVPVVRGMSMVADPGNIVAIIGPNGSGKSTFIKAVMGIVTPRAGNVELGTVSLQGRRCDEIVRAGVGYLPQTGDIFGNLTVGENLDMGGFIHRKARPARRDFVLGVFPVLAERLKQPARTLSGGERRVLGLARVLMGLPSVILMDEPTAGLAPAAIKVLVGHLEALRAEGLTLVVVEQNVRVILSLANWVYVMVQGAKLVEAPGCELQKDIPLLGRVFMGHDRDLIRRLYEHSTASNQTAHQ